MLVLSQMAQFLPPSPLVMWWQPRFKITNKYTNLMVGEHGIQLLNVMVVVFLLLQLSFDAFVGHKCTYLIVFEQMVCPSKL